MPGYQMVMQDGRNGSVSQFAGLLATLLRTTGKTPDMTFYS